MHYILGIASLVERRHYRNKRNTLRKKTLIILVMLIMAVSTTATTVLYAQQPTTSQRVAPANNQPVYPPGTVTFRDPTTGQIIHRYIDPNTGKPVFIREMPSRTAPGTVPPPTGGQPSVPPPSKDVLRQQQQEALKQRLEQMRKGKGDMETDMYDYSKGEYMLFDAD